MHAQLSISLTQTANKVALLPSQAMHTEYKAHTESLKKYIQRLNKVYWSQTD